VCAGWHPHLYPFALQGVYESLVRVYMAANRLSSTLGILTHSYDRVEPERIVELLPKTLTLAQVRYFLESMLRSCEHRKRDLQVTRRLFYLEYLEVGARR
jgi:hypothetical protein